MTLVFVCGAAITGLGLALATWCARLGRAVALTVTVYVLVTVGWLFVGILIQPCKGGVIYAIFDL